MRMPHAMSGAIAALVLGLLFVAVPARAGGPTETPVTPVSPVVPVTPVLTGISAAHAASARADLIRFHFRPAAPSEATARYVPASELIQDGSGLPVAVRGRSFVKVVFHNAAAHDEEGRATTAPRNLFPVRATTNVVQVQSGGDFEGVVTYFIGLREPAPGPQVQPTVQHAGTSVIVAIPTR
ncbi:AMIN-like domain-containing (lipo)protein [Parafrankia elaeagni]